MARPNQKLDNVKGHRTELERKQKELVEAKVEELKGDKESILKPPSYLPAGAKKEWKRIAPLLKQMELGELDLSNIEGYCISRSLYLEATKELKDKPLLITKIVKGLPVEVENPLVGTQKKYADDMRKFGNLIGMTPASRYTICTSKVNKEQTKIDEEFGDI